MLCSHDTCSRLPDPLKLVERGEGTRGSFRGSVVDLEETNAACAHSAKAGFKEECA